MTAKAKELLVVMASNYDQTKANSLDSFGYIGFPDRIIDELEKDGYIVKQNDIAGTIKLTRAGYEEAKK